ncbi:uncharacterized protein LOC144146934 [Haemaphysalis longicornis]
MDTEIERAPGEVYDVRRRLSHDDRCSWALPKNETLRPKTEEPGTDVDRRWSVALLASLAGLVAAASIRNSGFFFVRFRNELGGSGSSREAAAWPLTVLEVVSHMAGFPAAFLGERIDVFQVSVVGSVLLWAGLALASFARNVFWMCLTFGLVHGGGVGLVLVSLDKILMLNFNRYRGVANGLKCAGFSVSSFIFVRLLSEADKAWGFRWTLLLFALACTLTTAFCCVLLKISLKQRTSSVRKSECFCGPSKAYGRKSLPFFEIANPGDAIKASSIVENDGEDNSATRSEENTYDCLSASRDADGDRRIQCEQENNQPILKDFDGANRKADRHDGLDLHSSARSARRGTDTVRNLKSLFRLFREATFSCLMVSSVVSNFSAFVFFGTIVDYAIDKGATRTEAEWNIVSSSAAALVGSLGVPALADRGYVGRRTLVAVVTFFFAASLMWVPRVVTVGQYELAVMSAAACSGAQMNMRIVLLADYVPDQLFTLCLGLCGALFAPVALYCPAMIGYYRDNAGSYNDLYELLGLLQACVGMLLLVLVCSKRGKVPDEIPGWNHSSSGTTSI